ncbi:MAG: mitochondrial escape protein 2 [Bathelium mastoideum]|nr:MAG: mitochondrial escape protein 2 [Bathelium mastoideum]
MAGQTKAPVLQVNENKVLQRLQSRELTASPTAILENAFKEAPPFKVNEVLPRVGEGGVFVKFTRSENDSFGEIERRVKTYLQEHPIRPPWWPFLRVDANLVHGRPWVEDLFRRPSLRLKVEFLPAKPGVEAAELSQEQLYSVFRPYGKLLDIIPQPPDSKILPKFAYLDFNAAKLAIMAKNCLHGFIVSEAMGGGPGGTVLRLTYERKTKDHWIKDWIFNHPRIVVPVIAAIVAGITVAVFDPIRTFFIKAHITKAFHVEENRVWRWFKTQATDLFHRKADDDAGMEAIWDDRKGNIDQIGAWLMETADTFIVVQGPRGSGKKELVVDQALKHRKHKIVIDCKPIQEARGDAATISAAAQEVGYRPVFSWMNSISGLIDLAAQSTTGIKTGFSETLDGQLTQIWNSTATALKHLALEGRKKGDKDANLSDDEYLEAHPERRPIVVIDNFLHKSAENSIVYDKVADWAARLTTSNIAHVIFLTNDVSFSKSLSKALPDRVFRQISLSDCSPEVAKRFVITHLDAGPDIAELADGDKKLTPSQRRKDLAELDECISYLGGRLTDLEFLARRIKTGETPKKAVHEIIEQSSSEILKMFLIGMENSGSSTVQGSPRPWNTEQAWLLIKQLAENEVLRYNEVLLSGSYGSGGEKALQALEQAELITILSSNGRPHSIRAGKPVYLPAFKRLTQDRVLSSRLDLSMLSEAIKAENASVDKCENELKLLAGLPKQPAELAPRIRWLLAKVAASQAKVESLEKESGKLKKVLQEEF